MTGSDDERYFLTISNYTDFVLAPALISIYSITKIIHEITLNGGRMSKDQELYMIQEFKKMADCWNTATMAHSEM